MSLNILLVEPGYKCKYPPLGLMKISKYHKLRNDHVEFVKGISPIKRDKFEWDRIYISTLFTYDWDETIKTIKYYRFSVKEPSSQNLVIGGVMATLMAEDILKEVNCYIIKGLLSDSRMLGYSDNVIIDSLIPDYSILNEIDYKYPTANAYFLYSTRGCIRRCSFCAVHIIEPEFNEFIHIKDQIMQIIDTYGPKKDLLLLDNNVLASSKFSLIINEIKKAGFEKGAKLLYKDKNNRTISVKRYVDFNQGVDARLLTKEKMAKLSQIAINPLRIAFDDISYKDLYVEKIRLAAKYDIVHLSNYILYNYKDKPEDFYERLLINLELNEELGLQIFSFPMRYVDLKSKNRLVDTPGNLGEHWNKKYLRAIQVILHVTRGLVGTKINFFKKAFGKDIDEYKKILLMPEDYILNRHFHEEDGSTEKWWKHISDLNSFEKEQILPIILQNDFKSINLKTLSLKSKKVLEHYINRDKRKS